MKHSAKTFAKKYWYVMVTAVFAVAVVAGILALPSSAVRDAHAQSATPTISLTPQYDSSGYIKGVSLSMSGSGPFTENFQVAVCLQENTRNSNRIDCAHTPWAASSTPAGTSQTGGLTTSNYSQWWSAWSASPEETIDARWTLTDTPPNYRVDNWQTPPTNEGEITKGNNCSTNTGCGTCYDSDTCTGQGYYYDYGTGWTEVAPSVFIRTAPLPTGQVINNVQLGFEMLDANDDVQMWDANAGKSPDNEINANVCGAGEVAGVFTPFNGGTSAPASAYISPDVYGCTPSNEADGENISYFRVYMSGALMNATGVSNNIPTSTSPLAVMTAGTDGTPLTFTVQNTGSSPWISDQQTLVSKSGTCDGPGGMEPNWQEDNPGSSCVSTYTNSSNQIVLSNTAVGTDPLEYVQTSQTTCTLGSSYTSDDCADSACSGNEQACTTGGYCSNGGFNTPANCGMNRGTWTQGCNSQWVLQVSCAVTSGDPNVEPGATTTFTLPSLTAPATPGAYTEIWQMQDSSTPFGSQISVPIQVGPSSQPTSNVTVTVSSTNSVTGGGVYAGWYFGVYPPLPTDPNYDPCGDNNTICGPTLYETSSTSLNAPTGTFTLGGVTLAPKSYNNGDLLSLRSVQAVPSTSLSSPKINGNPLFALAQEFLAPIANAAHESITSTWSQTAINSQSILHMIILWDPDATLSVSNTSVSVTNSNPTGSFSVSNTGTTGSWLNWNATATNYSANSNGVNWLSISPSSGSNLHAGDPAVPVTITATPGSLASGTYTATVNFANSYSFPSGNGGGTQLLPSQLPSPVTVTFTVGNGSPSSCTANSVSVSCPATMGENTTTQCLASVNESGSSCTGTVTWSVVSGGGSITQNGAYSSPNSTGTSIIKAVSTDNGGVSNTANITITGSSLSGSPQCSNPIISASPANIVIPESSELSYNCQNVNSCTLTGSDGSNYSNNIVWVNPTTASGTQPVAPSVTTIYTFSCTTGGSGSSASVSLPVQVTVGGTSRCEQNPNGAGCSGQ